jgi:hypothetical protein
MKIYTKSGDAGTSSLYNGERRRKKHEIFHVGIDLDRLALARPDSLTRAEPSVRSFVRSFVRSSVRPWETATSSPA